MVGTTSSFSKQWNWSTERFLIAWSCIVNNWRSHSLKPGRLALKSIFPKWCIPLNTQEVLQCLRDTGKWSHCTRKGNIAFDNVVHDNYQRAKISQPFWCISVTLASQKAKQENYKFEARVDNLMSFCHKKESEM